MWMKVSDAQRWIIEDGRMMLVREPVEVFLDFDPVCPHWPPCDISRELENREPQQKGRSDA